MVLSGKALTQWIFVGLTILGLSGTVFGFFMTQNSRIVKLESRLSMVELDARQKMRSYSSIMGQVMTQIDSLGTQIRGDLSEIRSTVNRLLERSHTHRGNGDR